MLLEKYGVFEMIKGKFCLMAIRKKHAIFWQNVNIFRQKMYK